MKDVAREIPAVPGRGRDVTSTDHPVLYPDEHGDWVAANRGAALNKLRALRDWFEMAKLFPQMTESLCAEVQAACDEGVKAIEQRDELLAALKEARSLIRSQISDAALDEGYWPTLKPRIRALDAVIAKAEGAAPQDEDEHDSACTSCDGTGIRSFNDEYCHCSAGAIAKSEGK